MGENLRYSPLEWDSKNKIFDFGGAGVTGLLAAAFNTTGNVFYVDNSNTKSYNGYGDWGKSPTKPLQGLDWAIGRCAANNGDYIILMPGHAENVASAGAITCDVAGVTIIGLGTGAARPTFTWNSTDNSAVWNISAASVGIYNILGICGDDGLTKAFYVTGADCTLDITWRDPAGVEAARCILGGTGADRLTIKLKYEGDAVTGNACVAPIQLNGTDGGEIDINFYGIASTAVVNFITTACLNVNVRGYMYNSGTTDYSKLVVATIGGSVWSADIFDGAAGHRVFGGSGGAFGTEDLSTVVSDLIVVQSDVKVVVSDWATFTTQVSDLTTDVSDMVKQVSDLTTAVSDLNALNIASDIIVIQSDLALGTPKKVSSDLVVTQSDVKSILSDIALGPPKTIASDLVVVMSDVKSVNSDLIVTNAIVDTIASDLVVVMSDVKTAGSDLIVTNAIIDTIASDLVAVNNRCTTIASDIVSWKSEWNTFETILSDFVVQYASDQVANRAYLSDMWSDIKSDVA